MSTCPATIGRERLNALYRQACVEGKPTIRAAK